MKPSGSDGVAATILIHVDPDLEDLIPRFMDNRRNDIATMEKALAENDFETIKSLAHGLKGSGAGYGFDEITRIGVTVEQAAKAKNHQEIEKCLECLAQYLAQVEIVYG